MTNFINLRNIVFIIIFLLMQFCTIAWAADKPDTEIDSVLSSAESLFKSMNNRNYHGIWQLLSIKSRDTIVGDVYNSVGGEKSGYSKKMIETNFADGAKLSQEYWNAYLENFDPDTVLEQSKWEINSINNNAAIIDITFRKAPAPARLQMFKEEGRWKVGLVETFGTKK